MIRRVDHVHAAYEPSVHGRGWLILHDGQDHFRVKAIQKVEFSGMTRRAEQLPQWVAAKGRSGCWMYRGSYFLDDLGLRQAEVKSFLDELGLAAQSTGGERNPKVLRAAV